MKILMIAPEPFFEQRGTPISILYRLKALSKLGHRVDLLCYPIGEDVQITNLDIKRCLNPLFFKKVNVGPSFKKIFLDFFLFIQSLSYLSLRKYDAVHVHEEAAFIGIIIKHLFKTKLVYDMHSFLEEQPKNYKSFNNPLVNYPLKKIDEAIIKNADRIITISPYLSDIIRSRGRKPYEIQNFLILHSGYKPKKGRFTIKRDYLGQKIILYTGTLEKNQGIPLLLESIKLASSKVDSIKAVISGGTEKQVNYFKGLAQKLGLNEKVIFTGQISLEDSYRLMNDADMLVSPRTEGINTPLKIYAYLNAGKPLVATDIPSHRQVLNDKVALLAKPYPEFFANAIIKLLRDKKSREKLAKAAKEYFKTNYRQEIYIKKMKAVYRWDSDD